MINTFLQNKDWESREEPFVFVCLNLLPSSNITLLLQSRLVRPIPQLSTQKKNAQTGQANPQLSAQKKTRRLIRPIPELFAQKKKKKNAQAAQANRSIVCSKTSQQSRTLNIRAELPDQAVTCMRLLQV